MAKSRFRLERFRNPSGEALWRVAGMLNGQRIRKNFRSREAATAYRQSLDIEFLNGESEGQTVWTTLTHDQNRDAIAAVNLLRKAGSSKDLCFAVKYFLRQYDEASEDIPVDAAVRAFLEVKAAERDRGILSAPEDKSLRMALRRFAERSRWRASRSPYGSVAQALRSAQVGR